MSATAVSLPPVSVGTAEEKPGPTTCLDRVMSHFPEDVEVVHLGALRRAFDSEAIPRNKRPDLEQAVRNMYTVKNGKPKLGEGKLPV